MKKTIYNLALLFPVFGFSQNLKCEDFKTGQFTMTNSMFPGVEIAIHRTETTQTEIKIADKENITEGNNDMLYEKIEWLNDCKYKLLFDESKMKLTEITDFINKNGGVITQIVSIEGNCYFYESVVLINGKEEKLHGTICKDISN